jgi:hypothetical protein
MTDKEYFAFDAISQSSIKTFIENRKSYEYQYILKLGENKSTKAMDLGTLIHCLLFEPGEFHNRYAHFSGAVPSSSNQKRFVELYTKENHNLTLEDCYANSYSTKGLKDYQITAKANELVSELNDYMCFNEKHGHKEIITSEMEIQARRMVEIVLNHSGVVKTLVSGRANPNYKIYKEHSIVLEDRRFGRMVKCKIDEMHVDTKNRIIYSYDYKTTRSQNTNSFKGSVRYYGYDIQESFYSNYIKEWAKVEFGVDFKVIFRFIPQLNIAPYNVLDVVEFDPQDRENAFLTWSEAFSQLDDCLSSGRFDNPAAYSDTGVNMIKLSMIDSVVLTDGF